MADSVHLSPDDLRQLLMYDPDAGRMFWRERGVHWFRDDRVNTADAMRRAWNTKYAGREAFTARLRGGYRVTPVCGKVILGHRAAWAIFNGEWPVGKVDHINGIRDDNRIANLRVATDTENTFNRGANRVGTSRFKGVHWSSRRRHWIAQYGGRGHGKYLGSFQCEDDAAFAYDAYVRGLHGNFARLNVNEPRSI